MKLFQRLPTVVFAALSFLQAPIGELHAIPQTISNRIEQLVSSNPHQLSVKEYSAIAEQLYQEGPCNLLIFGTGMDSPLWFDLNKGGKTVYLEDNIFWAARTCDQIPHADIYFVEYNTFRWQWADLLLPLNKSCLMMELPEELAATKWDIIFVDGPAGWDNDKPGRMKSIYTAAYLAHKSRTCHVFVHDCDRHVEAIYSSLFLGDHNIVTTFDRLRHYYIPSKLGEAISSIFD